jgi:hypothetical protein
MKEFVLNRDALREIDKRAIEEYGMPGVVLMENAGHGAVQYLLSCNVRGNIVICCGKGNNAGDGFVVARYLDNLDLLPHVLVFANPQQFPLPLTPLSVFVFRSVMQIFFANIASLMLKSYQIQVINSHSPW